MRKLLLVTLAGIAILSLRAAEIPAKGNSLVNDFAQVIPDAQEAMLEAKLRSWDEDSSSVQIAIITETSLEGDDLWNRAHDIFNQWGIGQKGKNNGVLIYVAVNDRKVRIHTGRGAEQFLGDIRASRLIDEILKPAFRNQQYYEGLDALCDRIISLSRGEYTADKKPKNSFRFIIPLIVILLAFFLSSGRRGSSLGRFGRRGGMWFPGGGFGGGFGGGSSGGGWGGFGGGESGGGGSSGSW